MQISKNLKVYIVVLATLFVGAQISVAVSNDRNANLQQESYITGLQSTYQSDLRECLSLSQQADDSDEEKPSTEQITNQCIASVNTQRAATLLKERGYADLLESPINEQPKETESTE